MNKLLLTLLIASFAAPAATVTLVSAGQVNDGIDYVLPYQLNIDDVLFLNAVGVVKQ